jgi:hypothetical protein
MRIVSVRPPALTRGDTIAVVSPSWCGPAELPAAYRRGLQALRGQGFEPQVMAHAEGRRGWVSGTPEERVADLHAGFADPQVRAVLCTIGGLHSAQLVPLLDYELIAANPKVFCGYSDITSLHLAIHGASRPAPASRFRDPRHRLRARRALGRAASALAVVPSRGAARRSGERTIARRLPAGRAQPDRHAVGARTRRATF